LHRSFWVVLIPTKRAYVSPSKALIDASGTGAASSYRIVLVLSNVAGVAGLERAAAAGIETVALDHRRYAKRLDFDMAVHEALQRHRVQLVCLAGFMRILTPELTRLWRGRMLNVHPALLPAFKGIHAQRQALQAGVRITGCTVHFVEVHFFQPRPISLDGLLFINATPSNPLELRIRMIGFWATKQRPSRLAYLLKIDHF